MQPPIGWTYGRGRRQRTEDERDPGEAEVVKIAVGLVALVVLAILDTDRIQRFDVPIR